MNNLFSSFDPSASVFFVTFQFNWLAALGAGLLVPSSFWVASGHLSISLKIMVRLLLSELIAVFGGLVVPGTLLLYMAFFFFILGLNLTGLLPYVFTPSSHLSFTLALSLPLWLGTMLWSTVFQFNSIMGHLVPSGTPPGLMPVMVLIETVSSLIRPFTLAIRLAANMIAGHLLLTLLGSQGGSVTGGGLGCLMGALVLLIMLECAVACIQSYVFTILSSLYLNEVMGLSMAKKCMF